MSQSLGLGLGGLASSPGVPVLIPMEIIADAAAVEDAWDEGDWVEAEEDMFNQAEAATQQLLRDVYADVLHARYARIESWRLGEPEENEAKGESKKRKAEQDLAVPAAKRARIDRDKTKSIVLPAPKSTAATWPLLAADLFADTTAAELLQVENYIKEMGKARRKGTAPRVDASTSREINKYLRGTFPASRASSTRNIALLRELGGWIHSELKRKEKAKLAPVCVDMAIGFGTRQEQRIRIWAFDIKEPRAMTGALEGVFAHSVSMEVSLMDGSGFRQLNFAGDMIAMPSSAPMLCEFPVMGFQDLDWDLLHRRKVWTSSDACFKLAGDFFGLVKSIYVDDMVQYVLIHSELARGGIWQDGVAGLIISMVISMDVRAGNN